MHHRRPTFHIGVLHRQRPFRNRAYLGPHRPPRQLEHSNSCDRPCGGTLAAGGGGKPRSCGSNLHRGVSASVPHCLCCVHQGRLRRVSLLRANCRHHLSRTPSRQVHRWPYVRGATIARAQSRGSRECCNTCEWCSDWKRLDFQRCHRNAACNSSHPLRHILKLGRTPGGPSTLCGDRDHQSSLLLVENGTHLQHTKMSF